MELRQLRYFVTLAEELHFGRAAAREHIVQSALGQHIRRLEREVGVQLFERNTHHVRLTRSGEAMLGEVKGTLLSLQRAVTVAQRANSDTEVVRVSVLDASLDSMPQVLRNVQYNHANLVVDRIEAPVPTQYRMLADRTLDVGFGNSSHAPPGIASEPLRLDRLGVLIDQRDPLATLDAIPIDTLAEIPVILADEAHGPEFNQYVIDLYQRVRIAFLSHTGRIQSIRAAAYLVVQNRCAAIVPQSCDVLMPQARWVPLTPDTRYPWSLLWRNGDDSWPVTAVRHSARALQRKLGWLAPGPVGESSPQEGTASNAEAAYIGLT